MPETRVSIEIEKSQILAYGIEIILLAARLKNLNRTPVTNSIEVILSERRRSICMFKDPNHKKARGELSNLRNRLFDMLMDNGLQGV